MKTLEQTVPLPLRRWFIVHGLVDLIFALPLMLIPAAFLKLFGWQTVDVLTTRVVAAALLAIGLESLLGFRGSYSLFVGMLNLKIIWSSMVVLGTAWALLNGAQGSPPGAWALVAVFALFNFVWVYWRLKL